MHLLSSAILPLLLALPTLDALSLRSPLRALTSLTKRETGSAHGRWLKHILWVPDSVSDDKALSDANICPSSACNDIESFCAHLALGCRCIAVSNSNTTDARGRVTHHFQGTCGNPRASGGNRGQGAINTDGSDPGRNPGGDQYDPYDFPEGGRSWGQPGGGFGPSGQYWDLPCVCNATCVDPYCCESSTGFIRKPWNTACIGSLQETY